MKRKNILPVFCSLLVLFGCFSALNAKNTSYGSGKKKAGKSFGVFSARLLDITSHIFKDNFPADTCYLPLHTPRKTTLSLQVAIRSAASQLFTVSVINLQHSMGGGAFPGTIKFKQLLPVHIEGNTQGSTRSVPGGPIPDAWVPYFVRLAPFDMLEVIKNLPSNTLQATANETTAAMVQLDIPSNCTTGLYQGTIRVEDSSGGTKDFPFSFQVHNTVLPGGYYLDCTHWLSELPEDLKSGSPVASWSEDHWNLLVKAGKLLREYGDNVMFTPLVNNRHALIQSFWDPVQKKLSFNYSRFDRWINTFDTLGFERFAGHHVRFQGLGSTQVLFLKNTLSGDTVALNTTALSLECFQETFFADLDKHLDTLGIKNRYIQHVFDEPAPNLIEEYRRYNAIAKGVMHGVKTIDAINSSPNLFSPLVDIQVFSLTGIVTQKNTTVASRMADNKTIWLYNTSGPYPPHPNRQLDRPVTENRLWPWIAQRYNATGYLFYAANLYRGVSDEYASSLGALPDGQRLHPPGDAWHYYRSNDGLLPAMRMLNFREGMIDVTLLTKLRTVNPDKVRELQNNLIHPIMEVGLSGSFSEYLYRADAIPKGYETDPKKYYDNRKALLELLDAAGL